MSAILRKLDGLSVKLRYRLLVIGLICGVIVQALHLLAEAGVLR